MIAKFYTIQNLIAIQNSNDECGVCVCDMNGEEKVTGNEEYQDEDRPFTWKGED